MPISSRGRSCPRDDDSTAFSTIFVRNRRACSQKVGGTNAPLNLRIKCSQPRGVATVPACNSAAMTIVLNYLPRERATTRQERCFFERQSQSSPGLGVRHGNRSVTHYLWPRRASRHRNGSRRSSPLALRWDREGGAAVSVVRRTRCMRPRRTIASCHGSRRTRRAAAVGGRRERDQRAFEAHRKSKRGATIPRKARHRPCVQRHEEGANNHALSNSPVQH